MRHEDDRELFRWIDPEISPGRARPVKLAFRADRPAGAGRAPDRDTEAEAVAVDVRPLVEAAHIDLRPHMVAGHVVDGLASEDARAVERSAVQKHLRETQVV